MSTPVAKPAHTASLRMSSILVCAAVLGVVAMTDAVSADDWPQWRGEERLGVWLETGIVEELPEELKIDWRTPIRSGYSGPAVADGRVFITDWQEDPGSRTLDGSERILALDEQTGAVLWTHEWPTSYRMLSISYAVGPRATPTVDGDRVYVVGATGRLFCFDVETGAVRWQKDYVAEYGTSVPVWGIVSAPLVDGDRLLTVVGGEPDALVVAFDKRTGDELWRAIEVEAEMGYAQPIIYGGRRSPPVDRLASARPRVAEPGDRGALLGAAVGRLDGHHGGDPRAERQLSAGVTVLQRLVDDAVEPGPAGRDGVVAGSKPERTAR